MHNIRIMRNMLINSASHPMSTQPSVGGPIYWIRNIVYNAPGGSTRSTAGSPGVYFYNNTITTETNPGESANTHWRNNLMLGQNASSTVFSVTTNTNYSSSDYNGFRPDPGNESFAWNSPPFNVPMILADGSSPAKVETRKYATLEAYSQATKQDQHSVLVDYDIFMKVTKLDGKDLATVQRLYKAEDFDFRIKPGSAAVDHGVAIPNVTDGFAGSAPDLGALEVGQPVPTYGPTAAKMKTFLALPLVATIAVVTLTAQDNIDRGMVARIRAEGTEHSKVLETFNYITNVTGARPTGSRAHKQAADYVRGKLAEWGMTDARLEPFHFGRGWELQKFALELTAPRYFPMNGYPLAWTPSAKGVLTGTPIYLADKTEAQITALGDKLRGAIVLASPPQTVFTLTDRLQPADTNQPVRIGGPEPPTERQATSIVPANAMATLLSRLGAGAILRPGTELHGTATVGGNPSTPDDAVPTVVVVAEHYNMIVRMMQAGVTPTLRLELRTAYQEQDLNSYNVIAEIPGEDPVLRNETVLVGAHLDSLPSATGATDNADGAVAAVEAMRILKAVGAHPRRTIRVAIWSGEEVGFVGGKAYVEQHLADAGIPRQGGGVSEQRSGNRRHLRLVHGQQQRRARDLRCVARTAQGSRPQAQRDGQQLHLRGWRVRRRGHSGVHDHHGLHQLRRPHAPHQRRLLRSGERARPAAVGDCDGGVRLSGGDAGSADAAAAGGRAGQSSPGGRTRCGSRRRRQPRRLTGAWTRGWGLGAGDRSLFEVGGQIPLGVAEDLDDGPPIAVREAAIPRIFFLP